MLLYMYGQILHQLLEDKYPTAQIKILENTNNNNISNQSNTDNSNDNDNSHNNNNNCNKNKHKKNNHRKPTKKTTSRK